MRASALDKAVTFASEVLFEGKTQTLTKPEATLGDRIDLRISGKLEERQTMNESDAEALLISNLVK